MKRCYLDSNVLIYVKDSDSLHHKEAVDKVYSLVSADYQIYISSLVLDEFLYVFKYALSKKTASKLYPELKRAVKEVLEIPQLSIINVPNDASLHVKVVDYMQKYGLKPRDGYHLLTMEANNIENFVTFDNDFKKVFSTNVLKQI